MLFVLNGNKTSGSSWALYYDRCVVLRYFKTLILLTALITYMRLILSTS
jgi:hypothetical protein